MFQSVLRELVTRTEAQWAMIAGSDGVLLETDTTEFRSEAEALAAELAVLLRASRKASGNIEMGGLLTSLIDAERGKVLLRALPPDYFLAVRLEPDSYPGKAYFEINRLVEPLLKELSF
jgi:predicted regulator of Ras-like GTPase activity (Roadblock/LC7/MglB family)